MNAFHINERFDIKSLRWKKLTEKTFPDFSCFDWLNWWISSQGTLHFIYSQKLCNNSQQTVKGGLLCLLNLFNGSFNGRVYSLLLSLT